MTIIRAELLKILPNRAVLVLTGLYLLFLGIVIYGLQTFINKMSGDLQLPVDASTIPIYNFPDIWHNLAYVAGWFKIFLAIIILILVCNEFEFKTIRQNIINGWSRMDFLWAKLFNILLLSVCSGIFLLVMGLILGMINSPDPSPGTMIQKLEYIGIYITELVAYLSFTMLIGVLIRKTGLAIGLLILYYVIEFIISVILPEHLEPYLPLEVINGLIQFPYNLTGANASIELGTVSLAWGYAILFIALSGLIIHKRDL